jgi:hypothetical protein
MRRVSRMLFIDAKKNGMHRVSRILFIDAEKKRRDVSRLPNPIHRC